jgi:hypothetical protein
MTIFYLKKLMLDNKIILKKIIRQKIKENVKPRKLFKLITWDIRLEIQYIKK